MSPDNRGIWVRLMTSVFFGVLMGGASMVAAQPRFEDDFSSRAGGWPTGKSERGDEWGYFDGKYRVQIKVTAGQVAAGQIAGIPLVRRGRRLATLSVEADTVQKANSPFALYGLSCGTSPAVLYFFLVNANGHYFIVRDDAATGRAELLQTGTAKDRFLGAGENNRIRAECIGGEQDAIFRLTVNADKIAEVRGRKGETFDRTAFVVTTLHAIAESTRAVIPGVDKERPGSPLSFEAEVLFDNFVARVP